MLQSSPVYPRVHLHVPSELQHLLSQAVSSDFVEPILLHVQAKGEKFDTMFHLRFFPNILYLCMNFHWKLYLTHNIQYHMYCNQWLNIQEYMCMIHHHHNIYYHMHYHLLLWILGCYIYKLKGVICLQDFLFNFICFCNTCACIFTIDGSRYIVT